MKIPKKIKIGAIKYDVEIVDDLKSAGEYDGDKQKILIGRAKDDMMKVTLVHEIIHAINNEMEEVQVEFLAQLLYQVIKENPKAFSGGVSQK